MQAKIGTFGKKVGTRQAQMYKRNPRQRRVARRATPKRTRRAAAAKCKILFSKYSIIIDG